MSLAALIQVEGLAGPAVNPAAATGDPKTQGAVRAAWTGDRSLAAGYLPARGQAFRAVAKKNLLGLKGGPALSVRLFRLIETAFLLSIYYYH